MDLLILLPQYFVWHYGRGILDLKDNSKNFIVFVYNLFSIPVLISTLFSPWMRIRDEYKASTLLETFVFNGMMRVFGVFVRLLFIILGVVSILLTFIVSIVLFIVWFFLPVFLVMIFAWSIRQFF